ncbi:MAG: hypothetical protein AAB278_05815 [Pseudomonadota bacterium]
MDLIEKLGLSVFPHSKPFPEGEGLVPLSLGGAEWRFLNGRFRFGHEKGATKCRTVGTVRVATLQALSIISECLKMRTRLSVIYVALFGVLASPLASASCGSSACSVNTNWDEHSASQPGLSIDLRYSSTKLDQLRSGSNKITAEDPADPALTPGEEVENLYTKSQLVTATVDYTFDENWGVVVQLPYVLRTHKHTIADPAPFVETFSASALGDIKAVGRYRFALNDSSSVGIKAGLKLATGKKNIANDQGAIPGEVSLQPGNGSTDLIVGAFWQAGELGGALSYFAQGILQTSINHLADFKPGNQINLDAGIRYALGRSVSALLQLNYQANAQDEGSSAPADASGTPGTSTGGKFFYLSPGVSIVLAPNTNIYGLLQLPLSQNVNGLQLTTSSSFSLGINHRY